MGRVTALLVICCTAGCIGEPEPSGAPSFAIAREDGAHLITVTGLDAEASARLTGGELSQQELAAIMPVRVDGSNESAHAVLGEYRVRDAGIAFRPRFPLARGVDYRVEFGSHSEVLTIREVSTESNVHVTEIYPTADVLPANLLKFYIVFSAPMSRGFGYDYVRLFDETGAEVVDPFPAIGVELWDPGQRQFTLLLDPGRIKRGIDINESMGLPLQPGKAYRLVVDAAWPGANGVPLARSFEKPFRVVESDHTSPDYHRWDVGAPAAGNQDAVVVTFGEALDYSLADRFVWVEDAHGEIIDGEAVLSENESRWSFTRAAGSWPAGDYAIGIHSRLEDLAGNQIEKPFEVDVESGPDYIAEIQTYTIPFTIR